MTAQLRDTLEHAGNTMGMTSLPLSTYWRMNGSRQADDATNARHFADMGTFCWRRYTAQWRIEQEHLYLVEINATYKDGTPVALEDFSPATRSGCSRTGSVVSCAAPGASCWSMYMPVLPAAMPKRWCLPLSVAW